MRYWRPVSEDTVSSAKFREFVTQLEKLTDATIGSGVTNGINFSNPVGLTVDLTAGGVVFAGGYHEYPGATLNLTANSTNHIYLVSLYDGPSRQFNIGHHINLTGIPPADSIKVGQITTNAGAITSTVYSYGDGSNEKIKTLKELSFQIVSGGVGGGSADLNYLGTWDANANSPTIPSSSSGNDGSYYIVSVSGNTNIDGKSDWQIGDWIISNGVTWDKIDNSDRVSSVAGLVGEVSTPSLRSALGLGSAAYENIPVSGNALSNQVVYGNDTRLTNSRTPTAHTHPTSDIVAFDETVQDLMASTISPVGNVYKIYDDASNILYLAVSGFANTSHTHTISEITDYYTEFIASLGNTVVPSGNVAFVYEPISETYRLYVPTQQTSSYISDFAEAVDDRVASLIVASGGIVIGYNDTTNQIYLYAPSGGVPGVHTHTSSDITDFTEAVQDSIGNSFITPFGQISGAYDDTNNKYYLSVSGLASASHTHTSSDITDLTEVTQDNIASFIDVVGGQISKAYDDAGDKLYLSVSGLASSSHTHTASNITDFSEAVDDRVGALIVASGGIVLNYSDATNQLFIYAPTGEAGTSNTLNGAINGQTIYWDNSASKWTPFTGMRVSPSDNEVFMGGSFPGTALFQISNSNNAKEPVKIYQYNSNANPITNFQSWWFSNNTDVYLWARITPLGAGEFKGLSLTGIRTLSSSGTLTLQDSLALVTTGSTPNMGVVLPTAAGANGTGRIFSVRKVDSATGTVQVQTTSSQTINGASTDTITSQYQTKTYMSDGTNWVILSDYTGPASPFSLNGLNGSVTLAASGGTVINQSGQTIYIYSPTGGAVGSHTHASTDITDFTEATQDAIGNGFILGLGQLTGIYDDFNNKYHLSVTGLANASHTHTASDVTNFNEAVDDRVAALISPSGGIVINYDDAGNILYIYSPTGSSSSGGYPIKETPAGSVNGSNVTFTLANTPSAGKELVYLNGIFQDVGDDYTISGTTITMATAPLTGEKIRVVYWT